MTKSLTGKKRAGVGALQSSGQVQEGKLLGEELLGEELWFEMIENNVLCGRLLGRFVDSYGRAYYQVVCRENCLVRMKDNAFMAHSGDIVNVREDYRLNYLNDVEIPGMAEGAEYDIWYEVNKKISIGRNNKIWLTDVQTKRTKTPRRRT